MEIPFLTPFVVGSLNVQLRHFHPELQLLPCERTLLRRHVTRAFRRLNAVSTSQSSCSESRFLDREELAFWSSIPAPAPAPPAARVTTPKLFLYAVHMSSESL